MDAAVYLRISSDPTGQQLGVARQREDCLALCEKHGWTPVEYVDNDISASSRKRRPAYERMLTDITEGRIGAVVAWDLDRLHRRPIELEAFMAAADEHRTALATVSGDIDLSTAQGRLTARLKGSVAAHEIEHKRARQLRAAQQKAESGRPQWRKAFGYQDTESGPIPDPVIAPLVKRVYAHVLAGGSITDGARMLNAESAFGLNGKPWTASTLSLFLRSPRNAALRSHNGQILDGVKGTWPALVDEETWRAVQTVLTAPGRAPGRKSVRKHLLTGVLQCGKPSCDGYLSGQWVMQSHQGGPKAHSITYGCKKCRGVSVRAEHVEPLVYGVVAGRLARTDAADLLRDSAFDPEEAKRIHDEKQSLYAQIRAAESEYDEGIIDGRRLAARKERVAQKLADIERRMADADRLRVFDGLPLGTPEVNEKLSQLSPDRLRAVIDVLVEFTVAPVGKGYRPKSGDRFDPERVRIHWK